MDVEKAIKEVEARANGRTRIEGQEPNIDEVLVAEIERLRIELGYAIEQRMCQCSYDDGCRFARERDDALAEVKRLRDLLGASEALLHFHDTGDYPDGTDPAEMTRDAIAKAKGGE
jgi:hypothetical protein